MASPTHSVQTVNEPRQLQDFFKEPSAISAAKSSMRSRLCRLACQRSRVPGQYLELLRLRSFNSHRLHLIQCSYSSQLQAISLKTSGVMMAQV